MVRSAKEQEFAGQGGPARSQNGKRRRTQRGVGVHAVCRYLFPTVPRVELALHKK
jgi:hypothetical protein